MDAQPDPLEARRLAGRGYALERLGDARVIGRAAAIAFVNDALATHGTLYDYAARHRAAERLEGRAPLYVIPGPQSRRWVVRRLRHGGALAPLTGDAFLRIGTPRPFNELLLSLDLEDLGIPTPRVAAAVVYASRLTYKGDVAREEVADAIDLAACLFGERALEARRSVEVMAAAGRLIGALHRAGVAHPDLNLRNVLVRREAREPVAYILDVEKCRIVRRLSHRRRRAMLARFRRSVRKFEARTGRALGPGAWDAFRHGYAEGEANDAR